MHHNTTITQFLAQKISCINKFLTQRITSCTIKQISQKYSHILNIRCIVHSFNLITKDLIKHLFASKIIQYCKTLVTYFKKSHLPNNLLMAKISEKNILGGGLKTYVDTRWTTVYKMLKSVYQLEICLKEVL